MNRQRLLGLVRRALSDFNMIEQGDRIAVGLSGGKDSIALLYALAALRDFLPVQYSLCAVTVLLGIDGEDTRPGEAVCSMFNVPFYTVETDIGKIVFDERKEKNPCSLCSKMRKGALNNEAKRQGASKVALAHNKDDLIQTFYMSLFYEGRLNTFDPVLELNRAGLTQIRPLIYAKEADIKGFISKYGFDVAYNPCPANGYTAREEIKGFIARQGKQYDGFYEKSFTAVMSGLIKNKERCCDE